MAADAEAVAESSSTRLIGLISTAHFFSHFYMLLLPPLFPVLKELYEVGYTELGLAFSVFSLTTAAVQAPMGFVVDRFGGRKLLTGGLVLMSVAVGLVGVFPSYGVLLVLMALAGVANGVFHPADYALLSGGVQAKRLGRAFSFHTAAGYLGGAVAPLTVLALLSAFGLQTSLLICGATGVVASLWLHANRITLDEVDGGGQGKGGDHPDIGLRGARLLLSPPILIGLVFFMGLALAMRGISGFGVSALHLLYEMPLATAGALLSAYLFASPVGVLVGGWFADRTTRHDLIASGSLLAVALAILVVATSQMPAVAVGLLFAIAGLATGLVAPSRDMLIHAMTPPGESGKVFGFVTSGYNIAGIIGAPAFGYLLDSADPNRVFWAVGIISLLTMAMAAVTGKARRAETS